MRVSATTLEVFRLWWLEEWMPERELIAQVRGERTPAPQVLLGQAFGRILEAPTRYRLEDGTYMVPACGAWRFPEQTMAPALAAIDRDRTLFEVPGLVRVGQHEVACRADLLYGAEVVEIKTTLAAPRVERYLESYQWRYTLSEAELHIFRLTSRR